VYRKFFPVEDYGIMLVGENSLLGSLLQVKDEKTVGLDYAFDLSSFFEILKRDTSIFILTPKSK